MIRILEDGDTPETEYPPVVEWTERIFEKDGWLQQALGLEHRPQQEEMAIRVAQNLATNQPLLFEAGTGVGKSLAYLIPGLIHAITQKRPFLVSTHTISLQEQIREKDLRQCRTLFESVSALRPFAGFRTAFLVGRGNYVCHKRLQRAAEEGEDLFTRTSGNILESLVDWTLHSETGLRQELDLPLTPELWDAINADSSTCNRKNCPAKTCYYHAARDKVLQANLVILNHSLLFSLVAAGMSPKGDQSGVLFPNDFLVLDEAHTIPSIATNHLGASVSNHGIDRALRILHNPKTRKGLLNKIGNPGDRRLVAEALAANEEFFLQIASLFLQKRDRMRLLEAEWGEPVFHTPLQSLSQRLKALAAKEQDETRADEIRDHQARIESYRAVLQRFLELNFEGHVVWTERTGKTRTVVSLKSAPIDLAPALRQILFRRDTSVTLTSATLASSNGMDPFLTRIGAEGQDHGQAYSPFDYERNCQVYLCGDCPVEGGPTRPKTRDYWAEAIHRIATAIQGGTLVLFTSYQDMADVARRCREGFSRAKRPFFEQIPGGNRTHLLESFRKAGNGVLFGTESFWTGIDIPGQALSQVILTKLPFENPGHPVFQAREEYVRDRGGHPFQEISLPESILRFRQGIGRLIRKADDHGRIVILDSRVLSKPYGTRFVAALPKKNFIRFSRKDWDQHFPKNS